MKQRLALASGFILIFTLLLFSLALAQENVPAIELSSPTGASGETVVVQGHYFSPGDNCLVYWSGERIEHTPCAISQNGVFATQFSVPEATLGPHAVQVIAESSGQTALATFMVIEVSSPADALHAGSPWKALKERGVSAPRLPNIEPGGLHIASSLPDEHTFWAWDMHLYDWYEVPATLRYDGGTYCSIYVADDATWVTMNTITRTSEICDASYQTTQMLLGPLPDVDADPKLVVLMHDIRDDYYHDPFATTYTPAMFDFVNETVDPHSSMVEMIYLDINPTSPTALDGKRGIDHAIANAIEWNADSSEEVWLDESMAFLAEYVNGRGNRPEVSNYTSKPAYTSLTSFANSAANIGAAYLWGLYLHEQYGADTIKQIVQSPQKGMASITSVTGENANTIFHRWGMANRLDGADQLGYDALDMVDSAPNGVTTFRRPSASPLIAPNQSYSSTVVHGALPCYYCVKYYQVFGAGESLWIEDTSFYKPYGQSSVVVNSTGQTVGVPQMAWSGILALANLADRLILMVAPARTAGALDYYEYDMTNLPTPTPTPTPTNTSTPTPTPTPTNTPTPTPTPYTVHVPIIEK